MASTPTTPPSPQFADPISTTEIIYDTPATIQAAQQQQQQLQIMADHILQQFEPCIEQLASLVEASDEAGVAGLGEYKALVEEVQSMEAWARAKRRREEEEAREFKRCRYMLLDYMRMLDEEGYRPRPFWWADCFVDDDVDKETLEIYE